MVSFKELDNKSLTINTDNTAIKGFKNMFVTIKKIAPQEKNFSSFNKTSPVAVNIPINKKTGKVLKLKIKKVSL